MQILNADNQLDRILSIWQTEDLLRAHHFRIDHLLELIPNGQNVIGEWLESLSNSMQKEGITEKGHCAETLNYISELQSVYQYLVDNKSTEIMEVQTLLEPFFEKQRIARGGNESDVLLCFETLYSYYLMTLAKKVIPDSITKVAQETGTLIEILINHKS